MYFMQTGLLDQLRDVLFFLQKLADSVKTSVIPVLNIPREDFCLRTEAVYLFNRVGVDFSGLIFITDINVRDLQLNNKLQVTLVDHNLLAEHQKGLQDSVVEIIGE